MTTSKDIFQAIADPTRRAIIGLIATQAMTPSQISTHFDSSRQAVSKHIQILSESNLIKQKQDGREIYYYLNIIKMKEIDRWINKYRKLWEVKFNQLDRLLLTIKKNKS